MDFYNIVNLHRLRERQDAFNKPFHRTMQVTQNFLKRLGLEKELKSHSGCVNCLEWNDSGEFLASGSDDLKIVLWSPFRPNQHHTIQSGHHGNIFSVKFVPGLDDHCIVSGAADFKIRLNDFKSDTVTYTCSCHTARVKRLATAPTMPFMFWSAAEDGIILQHDLRASHNCSHTHCSNILLSLVNHVGRTAEAKCVAINPINDDLIAVGANDPYIRLYDRRMIRPFTAKYSTPFFTPEMAIRRWQPGEDNLPPGCVSYFVAGHLPQKQRDFLRSHRSLNTTYVTFSPDGKDLLANLGGEHIYLFNIASKRKQLVFNMAGRALDLRYNATELPDQSTIDCCRESSLYRNAANGLTNDASRHSPNCLHSEQASSSPMFYTSLLQTRRSASNFLNEEALDIKLNGDRAVEFKYYSKAISLYSSAIHLCPNAAIVYYDRARAYTKRGWDGDYYAAIRDCASAIEMDPDLIAARLKLADCLSRLKWVREAYDCLQSCRIKFQDITSNRKFMKLENDVKMKLFAEMSKNDSSDSDNEEDFGSFGIAINSIPGTSEQEKKWRKLAYDYEYRYCGHCNTTTDIKEANFFGGKGEFIVAGSDDGSIFFWHKESANIARVIRGDSSIVNCVQPHPTACILATSGIDPIVRLWSPRPEDGSIDELQVQNPNEAAYLNQRRMNADPIELMLLNMGYFPVLFRHANTNAPENRPSSSQPSSSQPSSSQPSSSQPSSSQQSSDRDVVQCRTS